MLRGLEVTIHTLPLSTTEWGEDSATLRRDAERVQEDS